MKGTTRITLFALIATFSSNTALQAWPNWQAIKDTAARYKDNIIGAAVAAGSACFIKSVWQEPIEYMYIKSSLINELNNVKGFVYSGRLSPEAYYAYIQGFINPKVEALQQDFPNIQYKTFMAIASTALGLCFLLPALNVMIDGRPVASDSGSDSDSE